MERDYAALVTRREDTYQGTIVNSFILYSHLVRGLDQLR